jgi:hypothetical protein
LGELDSDEAAALERCLVSSPELGKELLRQARLVEAIACAPAPSTTAAVVAASWPSALWTSAFTIAASMAITIIAVLPSAAVSRRGLAQLSRPSALAAAPAIAASDDLLIARVWAVQQLEDAAEELDLPVWDGDDAALADEEPADVDATLSWMVVALSDRTDSPPAEVGRGN